MSLPPSDARAGEIARRHDRAVALGLSTYLDPDTGLSVFTEAYLRARGTCCRSTCRHCPWGGRGPT